MVAQEAKETSEALQAALDAHTLNMQDASFNLQREYKALEREANELRHKNIVLETRVEQLTLELSRKDELIADLRTKVGVRS